MNFQSNTICLLNRLPSQRSWFSGGSSFYLTGFPQAQVGKKDGLMLVRIALCIMTLRGKRGFLIISVGKKMMAFSNRCPLKLIMRVIDAVLGERNSLPKTTLSLLTQQNPQRFLSVHAHVSNLFRIRHRYEIAADYRGARRRAFGAWKEVTCAHSVA
jgi:hypothetical protein